MAILYDARGNPFQGSLDAIGGETFTDARTAGATLGALNAELVMDLHGKGTVVFDCRTGAANLTLVFEGTVDGTNYVQLEQPPRVTTSTIAEVYRIPCEGFRRVRCRVSAYTSGNVIVIGRASSVILPPQTNLWVTVTAAANTAATITLPAAGAGLFHYIKTLRCDRNATAVLAGTATLLITTTNLPGSPVWSVGNAMVAGGTQKDVEHNFDGRGLKSLSANTATTIIMPAPGAAVLWRGNCGYYAAP